MASLPSQASRRRSYPTEQTSSPPAQESSTRKPETPESQSIPLNNPQASTKTTPATTASEPPKLQSQQEESRICWICQQDDTEDRPEDGEWRNPCSCSLTAHEPCLLEWIADQEAPKPGQYNLMSSSKLTCPQCKDEIKVKRPRAPIVELYGGMQRLAKGMILPTALSGLMGCVYSGLLVYGLNTTYMVFGTDAARALLGPRIAVARINPHTWRGIVGRALHALDPFFPTTLYTDNYKLFFALPLVGPALILLRTSLADQASALLLPIYFANSINKHPHWTVAIRSPPTPGLVFATIPFLKKAYNALYHYTFSDLEKEWDRAVQRKPREGETAEQIEQQAANAEGEAIFDVEFIHEEVDIDGGPAVAAQEAGQAEPNADIAEGENVQRPQVLNRWAMRQDVSVVHVITTVMGALFFPTISSFTGDVLKVVLPPKWIGRAGKGGILREKWGRTVVGGCLFVVLKDVVTLYVKWRRARDFGKRKVLDYVGKKGVKGGKK